MKQKILKQLTAIIYILLPLMGGGWMGVSCSESASDDDEYANWQVRNEQYFASVVNDSLKKPGWQRIKNYSLNETTEGAATEYIYVKVIESGDPEGDLPAFTDSVRVAYQGRLIPSKTYAKGKVFDGTVYGTYNNKTNANAKFLISNPTMISGFSTALQHMRRGDHWRVYIPTELAYGATGSGTSIPPYSLLIFEMTLIDFSPAGQTMPVWSGRVLRDMP
ncbi:MAG: FKBP-type peptidyl-prolyl cis-trans isomerase [Prevotella sp.]|nr:FKBP-type peptidyl-prolyl cis-trans isomerase [Prevotella sp.]